MSLQLIPKLGHLAGIGLGLGHIVVVVVVVVVYIPLILEHLFTE